MKKLGRKEAWDKCMRMWDWMISYIKRRDREEPDWNDDMGEYKGEVAKNAYLDEHPQSDAQDAAFHCFFCERANHRSPSDNCDGCPPKEIAKNFHCEEGEGHGIGRADWNEHPLSFYRRIKIIYYKACKKHHWKAIDLKN